MKNSVPHLDRAGYRHFGLTTALITVALFGLLIPWLFDLTYPVWPWVIACILSALACFAADTLKPVYNGWMKFGQVMNWINTRVILGIVFFGLIFPTGIVMRGLGNDPMKRKLDRNLKSYRITSTNNSKDHLEHPY